jgi:hypothetical protein
MSSSVLHAVPALAPILSTAVPMEAARARVLPAMVYGARPTCHSSISLHPGLDTPCERSLAKAAVGAAWVPASDSLKQTQWIKGAIIGRVIGAVDFGTLA